ncbi:MAG: helix-turn-helix domain-containing protein [Betaproteobacteria bacterium]
MADLSEALAAEAAAAAPPAPGFGAMLRAERERQGLTREGIAARLRLPLRQIDALEGERLDAFPTGPFVRGFVRNYAKVLGIDAQPLLADLQARMPAPAVAPLDLGTTRRAGPAEALPRRLVLWGGVVALGAFGLIGLLVSRPPPVEPAAPIPAAPTPALPTAPVAAEPVPAPVEPSPSPTAGAAPAAGTVAPVPPPAVAAPALRIVIGSRPSWIEVAQADGRVIASGLQPAGSELKLEGTRPLRLVIGNASGVTIEANGQPVPLSPHIQSDVARLTLD